MTNVTYEELLEELVLQVLGENTWMTCAEIHHQLYHGGNPVVPLNHEIRNTLARLERLHAVKREARIRRGYIKDMYFKMRDNPED